MEEGGSLRDLTAEDIERAIAPLPVCLQPAARVILRILWYPVIG